MLWKIYFWIMFVLLIGSMFLENEEGLVGAVIGFAGMLISIISTVGFYGYVYKKQFFSQSLWKIVFIITGIEVVVSIIYYGFQYTAGPGGFIFTTVFTFITMYPLLLGLYRYGFQQQKSAF